MSCPKPSLHDQELRNSPAGYFSERARLQRWQRGIKRVSIKGSVDYCINGITRGYLKSSPFGALTLAIIIQMTLRTPRNMIIGIPIRIKHKGIASIM